MANSAIRRGIKDYNLTENRYELSESFPEIKHDYRSATEIVVYLLLILSDNSERLMAPRC